MKTSFLRFVLPLAALAFMAPSAALAQKNSGNTGPAVIPGGTVTTTYIIDKPGAYLLGGNRLMSDPTKPAIKILAPDVTLDLGGFSVAHPAGSSKEPNGHLIDVPGVENVEIRNGSLLNASNSGVLALGGKGLRAENLRVVAAGYVGIHTTADGSRLDRIQVIDPAHTGIYAPSTGVLATDCVFHGGNHGLYIGPGGRVVRAVVRDSNMSIYLVDATAVDSIVTNSTYGVIAQGRATIRDCELMGNYWGVAAIDGAKVVLIGTRLLDNMNPFIGSPIFGPGNVTQ